MHSYSQEIAFPAPPTLSPVLLKYSVPARSSVPLCLCFLLECLPPFFLSHSLIKSTSSWKPSITLPPGSSPFTCLCACLYSSPAFPISPEAKGDSRSFRAGIFLHQLFLPQHPVWSLLRNRQLINKWLLCFSLYAGGMSWGCFSGLSNVRS